MKFTLIFDGDLPASGNKPKPDDVRRIREQFHPQLQELWSSHRILRALHHHGYEPPDSQKIGAVLWGHSFEEVPTNPYPTDWVHLCAPIVRDGAQFRPLVRKSLSLACDLDILFMRREDPGALVFQGGDLDNRIKTLFDGLRIPAETETHPGAASILPHFECLLESDSLINGLSLRTDRLLTATSNRPHTVRLVIEVTTKVLEVNPINAGLLGL